MTGEVVVDALPHIDQGYDEEAREAVLAVIKEECRRYRPTKNYLEHLPPLNTTAFETPLMRAEFERLQSRLPMETMSMKRYELPSAPPRDKLNDLNAWTKCIEKSQAKLEYQTNRILNLQLMLYYCRSTWQHYLQVLTKAERVASKKLAAFRQAIQKLNCQLQSLQTKGEDQLRQLEEKWVQLVSLDYEIEHECRKGEESIDSLKQITRIRLVTY